MYNVYFDSGTSNTRAYLIKDDRVVDILKRNIGSKDSSIAGNNLVLLEGLKQLYDQLLQYNQLKDRNIQKIYASGMVTCPFGIKEVPHISTPVSLEKLCNGIYKHYESKLFKRDMYLIRGVKTITEDFKVDKYNIVNVNNMRGEEIEIFGILSQLPRKWQKRNIAIFLPGSHTHIAYIKRGILYGIVSTISGELFYALSTSTILSGSIQLEDNIFDENMVLYGFENLCNYGINRALYIAHAMKIFDVSNNSGRNSYLEGVITGGVVLAFERSIKEKWKEVDKIIICGRNNVTKVYEIILKEIFKKIDVVTISASEKKSFAVSGLLKILERRENNV